MSYYPCDVLFSKLKRIFTEKAPDWLFALVAMPYWRLNPHCDNVIVIPHDNCWLVIKDDLRFFVPDPREGKRPLASEHSYECYFEIKRGDTVLDVGAGYGQFTIYAAKKVGKGVVVAIEPEPKNLANLRANVNENGLSNVYIVGKAVSNCKKKSKLYLGKGFGTHSLINDVTVNNHLITRSKNDYIEIPTSTLDNIISNLGIKRIDFLKMDVEGAELEALRGSRMSLNMTEKLVVAAYHCRHGRETWPEVQQFLRGKGFEVHVTDERLVYAWKTGKVNFNP